MDKQTQGVEDMLFSDVLKKWYVHVEYPGVIKKNVEFPRGVTQFSRISTGSSFLLSVTSKGKVTNLETPGFFKKYVFNNCRFFLKKICP